MRSFKDWLGFRDQNFYVASSTGKRKKQRLRTKPRRERRLQFETLEERTVFAVGPDPGTVELTEAFGYGFEGDDLTFLLKGTSSIGGIASYQVDVDQNGTFDVLTTDHRTEIGGALMLDLPLLDLLGAPVEEGIYQARLRITNTQGAWQDFPFDIEVGNTPPAIGASGPEYALPLEVFTLSVATPDPGPDTVTNLLIAWGDGSSDSYSTNAGSFDHIYAEDGIYEIRVTATDEDGTWSLDHLTNIGATDAESPASVSLEVTSAVAEVLPSGNAEVTINAVDSQGNPIASYHWDLDGDGEYEYAGGSTVVISPVAGFYPYIARVRLIDSLGNTSDVLLAFLGAGPAETAATIANLPEQV